jgi:hypothetical protein
MNIETQEKLQRYLPIRVAVRLYESKVQGRVEHSFSMDWDDTRVNVFWSGKAYSILGEHQLDGVSWAAGNVNKYNMTEFVIDPLAEDSPIEVDWESWLAATDKFNKRNAKFKVKPHGVYLLRALAAERELAELKPRYESRGVALTELREKFEKLDAIMNPPQPEDDESDD